MKTKKGKIVIDKGVRFQTFWIRTAKPQQFMDEFRKLCNKHSDTFQVIWREVNEDD